VIDSWNDSVRDMRGTGGDATREWFFSNNILAGWKYHPVPKHSLRLNDPVRKIDTFGLSFLVPVGEPVSTGTDSLFSSSDC